MLQTEPGEWFWIILYSLGIKHINFVAVYAFLKALVIMWNKGPTKPFYGTMKSPPPLCKRLRASAADLWDAGAIGGNWAEVDMTHQCKCMVPKVAAWHRNTRLHERRVRIYALSQSFAPRSLPTEAHQNHKRRYWVIMRWDDFVTSSRLIGRTSLMQTF